MKKANKKLIMRYLVETGPHSRLEIAQFTKLANSATWRITDELMKEGLIEQKGFYSATSRKKSSVFGPSRSFALSIIYNVEVLETIVGIGYLDGSWEIVETFPTGTLENFLKNVEKTLEKLEKDFP
ncbi:MAG: ArsR family transcriptional regulator, partial [Thermotogae bacterium]